MSTTWSPVGGKAESLEVKNGRLIWRNVRWENHPDKKIVVVQPIGLEYKYDPKSMTITGPCMHVGCRRRMDKKITLTVVDFDTFFRHETCKKIK